MSDSSSTAASGGAVPFPLALRPLEWVRFRSLVFSLWSWCSSFSTARSTAANPSGADTLQRTWWPWPTIVTSQTSLSALRRVCSSEKWTSARSMPSRNRASRPILSTVLSRSSSETSVWRLLTVISTRAPLGSGRLVTRLCEFGGDRPGEVEGGRARPTRQPGARRVDELHAQRRFVDAQGFEHALDQVNISLVMFVLHHLQCRSAPGPA